MRTIGNSIIKSVTAASVFVEPELTEMAVGYMLDAQNMIHSQVFPSVSVELQRGKYPVFPRGALMANRMEKRGDGAQSAGGQMSMDYQSYDAEVWAWHIKLGKQLLANGKRLDLNRMATERCASAALINREVAFIEAFMRTGVWSTDILAQSSPTPGDTTETLTWLDEDAEPIEFLDGVIHRAKLRGAGGPNKLNRLVMTDDVWIVLKNHPNVRALINGGQTQGPVMFTTAHLASLLGIEKVLVADTVYTTSVDGDPTATYDFMAPTGSILLAHAAPNATMGSASAGLQFNWTGYENAGPGGQQVSSWWEQKEAAQYYEIEQAYGLEIVAPDLGVFISGLLSTPA